MDHNDFKCCHSDCGKSFRKESLLQWHYKHYHPGKDAVGMTFVTKENVLILLLFIAVATTKTKSPIHKSPSNKQPLNPAPPTPPTLLAVAKQQEQAVQSATQAINPTTSKPHSEKSTKVKKEQLLTMTATPVNPSCPITTSPSISTISTPIQSSVIKELLPITTKISVPKEPIISPFLPSLVGTISSEVKKVKGPLGVTSLANSDPIKLSSNVTMELFKGSAIRMIAPKPSMVKTGTTTNFTSSISATMMAPHSSTIGTMFKGFSPVTTITASSTHTSWVGRTVHSTPQPSSPVKRGVVIKGHPRGETSRPRGATISHVSDDSSIEDLDVGEEYRPSTERHPRASRPFGSSSCSYYCSGNKDDVIHCLCGSFEDEGFMIQVEHYFKYLFYCFAGVCLCTRLFTP